MTTNFYHILFKHIQNQIIGLIREFLKAQVFFLDLQSEFKAVPQSIRSIQGESITIYCDPPKGQPEPQVKWKKNGQIINFDNVPSR